MVHSIAIRRHDDMHLHLCDDAMLRPVLPCTVRQCSRAIVMPIFRSPVTAVAVAQAYQQRILAALPARP